VAVKTEARKMIADSKVTKDVPVAFDEEAYAVEEEKVAA